jgi:hypothetical protein
MFTQLSSSKSDWKASKMPSSSLSMAEQSCWHCCHFVGRRYISFLLWSGGLQISGIKIGYLSSVATCLKVRVQSWTWGMCGRMRGEGPKAQSDSPSERPSQRRKFEAWCHPREIIYWNYATWCKTVSLIKTTFHLSRCTKSQFSKKNHRWW